jgi:4-amino-4-deoxy-L-arabinose transferase-like glycosyltransferase
MQISAERRQVWSVLALLAVVLFSALHRGGLAGYDDAVYAHEGQAMLRTGDWWNVQFNGDINREYPPLFIWLQAISMAALGETDVAAKLPAAVFGLISVGVLYALVRAWSKDHWLALSAMVILATTQPYIKLAGHAMTDVPFTCITLGQMYCYWRASLAEQRSRKTWWLGVALLGLLAVLTRSVLGFWPLLAIALHLFWRHFRSPSAVGRLESKRSDFWAWSACLAVSALPMFALFAQALGAEHAAFITDKIGSFQFDQFFRYLWLVPRYFLPWIPLALAGLWFFRPRSDSATTRNTGDLAFWWFWLAAVLLPISFVTIKYPRYAFPAYPALAVFAALALHRIVPIEKRPVFFRRAFLMVIAGFSAIAGWPWFFPPKDRASEIRPTAENCVRGYADGERLLVFRSLDRAHDWENQILWYANRQARRNPTEWPPFRTKLLVNAGTLEMELKEPGIRGIIDTKKAEELQKAKLVKVLFSAPTVACVEAAALEPK